MTEAADMTPPFNPGSAAQASSSADGTLGKADCPIRVLNFAGGAFDTIIQLGVAHALLVIQGRAPDAIVGVSAGAIQAVAVTEIFQAGGDIDVEREGDGTPQDDAQRARSYQRRRAARVERFRDMVNAAQRAPEALIDASLPDAYQIESHDPLQPLRTARFAPEERDAREKQLRVRSGLIALYNDVLGVHLPIGAITRMVRRWLGFRAADAIPDQWKWRRRAVKALELFRFWLLIGTMLPRLVTVVPLLLRPLFRSNKVTAHVATAGSLIFRFRALNTIGSALLYVFGLFILAVSWVAISTLPSIIVVTLLVVVPGLFSPHHTVPIYMVAAIVLPYLVPVLIATLQVVHVHDAVTRRGALRNALKGVFQFAVLLAFWGGLPFVLVLALQPGDLQLGFNVSTQMLGDHLRAALPFLGGALLPLLVILWALLRYVRERGSHASQGHTNLTFMQWYGKQFLKSYSLSRSLLHHYGLEKFLSDLFDPSYYGASDRGRDWEESLNEPPLQEADLDESNVCKHSGVAKKIGDYCSERCNPPIAIGLAVADVGSGKVDVMDEDASVVCGLRAATAWTPLFPPVRYKGRLFVDSMNISPVPMPALMRLLRRHGVHRDATVVHVYRVAAVPFSRPRLPLPRQSRVMLNLIDIALRAVKLRQLRDADLERRLTERYSQFIPTGKAASKPLAHGESERFRIWVAPIELELPLGLNARIMFANRDKRREEILRTIAQGCRAALEVMIADAIRDTRGDVQPDRTVPCAAAVHHHLTQGVDKSVARVFGGQRLPGARPATVCEAGGSPDTPPGLWEICRHCELGEESADGSSRVRRQVVVWREWEDTAKSWPHELESDKDTEGDRSDRHFVTRAETRPNADIIRALSRYWPQDRVDRNGEPMPAQSRPLISLLFSGGVFRGVFQVGVINALNILGVKPDIVAGASIGSITAGMAAQLLAVARDAQTGHEQLARLAATYLAVDRVILTDRFADFVREFTIRAAATRFSLRQADQLFRKYDQPWFINFDKGARQVTGGIERLFYVNPYQLNQLVKAARHRNGGRASRMACSLAQQWLNRMNVGEEVLGAEALSQLIEYFIPVEKHNDYFSAATGDAGALRGTFAPFLSKGVMLLATATDLTDGQLLALGDPFRVGKQSCRMDLASALLASSAFPGVFRPRWAPEVFPDTYGSHQLIDGGVMDNLPIDAALKVLWKTSAGCGALVKRRPVDNRGQEVPHLAFAASLEPDFQDLSEDDKALRALEDYWPALRTRATQLGYNMKLDMYHEAAAEISTLYESDPSAGKRTPLNLEIVALKPRWLCDTFAFHPMLGYRRAKQAESIAHGCAQTLMKFKEYAVCETKDGWLDAWNVKRTELPVENTLHEARERWEKRKDEEGTCWLRSGGLCPFSKSALKGLDLQKKTKEELSYIHTCCAAVRTHEVH